MIARTVEPASADPRRDEFERSIRLQAGAQLRCWRVRRGYTQLALARAVGVTQATLSGYERGKRDLTVALALDLTAALDVALNDLVSLGDEREVIVARISRLGDALDTLRSDSAALASLVAAPQR